jgi:hypothetical protein
MMARHEGMRNLELLQDAGVDRVIKFEFPITILGRFARFLGLCTRADAAVRSDSQHHQKIGACKVALQDVDHHHQGLYTRYTHT